MIGSTRQVAVYAYGAPVDMRKGFDGVSALVTQGLSRDPPSGDLYVFTNRPRTGAKVLMWDGTGLCVYAKRLEQGHFAALWRDDQAPTLTLTMSELQLFLEGSALVGRLALSPAPFVTSTGRAGGLTGSDSILTCRRARWDTWRCHRTIVRRGSRSPAASRPRLVPAACASFASPTTSARTAAG